MDLVSSTSSSLYTTMGIDLLTACSISRRTWGELLELAESMHSTACDRSTPSMISWAYSLPEGMSRGAIKQVCPAFSKSPQTFSALSASLEEWDINTYIIFHL